MLFLDIQDEAVLRMEAAQGAIAFVTFGDEIFAARVPVRVRSENWNFGTNAHWDARGEYFVAEGDESDGTLRCFHPEHCLILNIEEEHLDFYSDLAAIEKVFAQLIEQTTGKIFHNIDDPNTARLCATRKDAISFGFSDKADYRGANVKLRAFGSDFCVYFREHKLGEAVL